VLVALAIIRVAAILYFLNFQRQPSNNSNSSSNLGPTIREVEAAIYHVDVDVDVGEGEDEVSIVVDVGHIADVVRLSSVFFKSKRESERESNRSEAGQSDNRNRASRSDVNQSSDHEHREATPINRQLKLLTDLNQKVKNDLKLRPLGAIGSAVDSSSKGCLFESGRGQYFFFFSNTNLIRSL
jgi:hypothetical protein